MMEFKPLTNQFKQQESETKMANNCRYYLKAVSEDKNALERLYKIMKYEDTEYCISSVREAYALNMDEYVRQEGLDNVEDTEGGFNWLQVGSGLAADVQDAIYEDYAGYFWLFISGDVAGSAESWFNGEDTPEERAENGARRTSLNTIAKALGIGIELWGHEEFYTFQEHFIMNVKGAMAVAETKDWNSYSESEIHDMKLEFKDMDEDEKKDCPLNDPDFDPDAIGFGEDYCSFSSAGKIYEAKAKVGKKKSAPAKKTTSKKPACKKAAAKKVSENKINLEYKVKDDAGKRSVVITGTKGKAEGLIKIPVEIEKIPVVSIGDSAFYGCGGLMSVTIPDGVTSIGEYAFYYCSGLTSVTIPDSVTSIGDFAFEGCSGLTSVTIGNGVTCIGNSAFEGCSGLKSITIPGSVTSIGGAAFRDCSGLKSVTIPNNVTSIGANAFSGCSTSLFDIKTISGVKLVDGWVVGHGDSFSGDLNLTGVRGIGASAFEDCSGLTSVTIGNCVTSIGSGTFWGCSALTGVVVLDSVTSIEDCAFAWCKCLKSVSLPKHLEGKLPRYVFNGCPEDLKITYRALSAATAAPKTKIGKEETAFAQKTVAKKDTIKKGSAKKPAAKKTAAKKLATQKPAAKKFASKEPIAKKDAVKKPATKKPAVKKVPTKKPTAKKAVKKTAKKK